MPVSKSFSSSPSKDLLTALSDGFDAIQAYLGGIEGQALDGLQKGLDGVIAGGMQHTMKSCIYALPCTWTKLVSRDLCVIDRLRHSSAAFTVMLDTS